MPTQLTNYQQKALLAAGAITSNNPATGYSLEYAGRSLILTPYFLQDSGRRFAQPISVDSENKVLCRDKDLSSEFERAMKEIV